MLRLVRRPTPQHAAGELAQGVVVVSPSASWVDWRNDGHCCGECGSKKIELWATGASMGWVHVRWGGDAS